MQIRDNSLLHTEGKDVVGQVILGQMLEAVFVFHGRLEVHLFNQRIVVFLNAQLSLPTIEEFFRMFCCSVSSRTVSMVLLARSVALQI